VEQKIPMFIFVVYYFLFTLFLFYSYQHSNIAQGLLSMVLNRVKFLLATA